MSHGLDRILVFADGASSGNPGPGGWGAVVALPEGTVWELGGSEAATTNNRMELQAVMGALASLTDVSGEVLIFTDSVYVIKGITQWIWAWRSRGWKTAEGGDVANAELWKKLFSQVAARREKGKIEWRWVKGHSGVPGNERVDEIASAYAQRRRPQLYRGPLLQYSVAIHDLPEEVPLPERPRETKEKVAAFSYLSLVNGTALRHPHWRSCEARVKGRPGAKFKKAQTEQDEEKILKEWGVDSSRLKPASD
jgi:ribonuclease HI